MPDHVSTWTSLRMCSMDNKVHAQTGKTRSFSSPSLGPGNEVSLECIQVLIMEDT